MCIRDRVIPLERLLIETDAPDQPPPRFAGGLNPPASLWEVAEAVARLKQMTPTEILDITTQNFKILFGV
ncbi:MAG: TatD family hydrolase, partial [Bdellovibrionaceae bacterium]|nr:TatD family hydrolase [Pseudobdellovibrionaceae bacterium]